MEELQLILQTVDSLGGVGRDIFLIYVGGQLVKVVLVGVFILVPVWVISRTVSVVCRANSLLSEVCRILKWQGWEGENEMSQNNRDKLISFIVEHKDELNDG